MNPRLFTSCMLVLGALTASAQAQRAWIVYPSEFQGNGWHTVPSGDYDGRAFRWGSGWDGVRRVYWDVTAGNAVPVNHSDLFPVKPALYYVQQWIPTTTPNGIEWGWLPIEANFTGSWLHPDGWPYERSIPWAGAFGQNRQWIGMDLDSPSGTWDDAGPGPQAPDTADCHAPGGSGRHLWIKRNTALYTKFDFGFPPPPHAATAVMLTEAYPEPVTCVAATLGGPVDLRCLGNADPLYGVSEIFGNSDYQSFLDLTIDGQLALAAEGYTAFDCVNPGEPYNQPIGQGLPQDGVYTAVLPQGDAIFQLRYDGLNTLKWHSGQFSGPFDRNRVFTLNGVPGREFVEANYGKASVLFTSSGDNSGGQIVFEFVYTDATSSSSTANLFNWFDSDGDQTAAAVGVGGQRRADGGIGFQRINEKGESRTAGGGTTNGAFLFVHTAEVDSCKRLARVNISINNEANGQIQIVAITLGATTACCSTPWADADKDGDVDSADFGPIQACFNGLPSSGPETVFIEGCSCFDADDNTLVDVGDLDAFVNCATGPGIPFDLQAPPQGCTP